MRQRATVAGGGIAALSCARLLSERGWEVDLVGGEIHPLPPLVLNEVTLGLLLDVWSGDREIFAGGHRLTARRVRWGAGAPEVTVRAPALAIRGDLLVAALRQRVLAGDRPRVRMSDEPSVVSGDWIVNASGSSVATGPGLALGVRTTFGRRRVISAETALDAGGSREATRIETVEDAWLHVAPSGCDRAIVQAMVPTLPPDPLATLADLLTAAPWLGADPGALEAPVSLFPAAPAFAAPLCGPGWICVGDAAVAFDPLSGAGAGHAVRSALLASAVLGAITSGLPSSGCLGHYEWRLRDALVEHLGHCVRLYSAAFSSPVWRAEIGRMRRGLIMPPQPEDPRVGARYLLRGANLEPSGPADPHGDR